MPRTLRRKVVVLGDPAVGKSALVHMFSSSGTRFPKQYNMTCGVELAHKLLMVAEGEAAVELYMFDSGGQDLFDEMMPPLWEGAEAAVLVYDVTRPHTIDACAHRFRQLLELVGRDRLPGAVVANKIDLHERAVIERSQGHALAEAFGLGYFEASAKDGDGIDAPFQHIAAELLKEGNNDNTGDDVAQDL